MYGWIWLAAIVVFLALEAGTSVLVSIWFAGGALAALIAMLLGASFTVQFFVFLIVSVGCVI
ncbi:MAG: NfeD family protein, partial [Clostridia bacterium]|nr:NfeD family protein [Clostridia bacterium]